MSADAVVRQELVFLLARGNAHMSLKDAVEDFPEEYMNSVPPHVSYTPWHILEHMRRTQRDIMEFIVNPDYKDLEWPADYWPSEDEQVNHEQWQQTINDFHTDLERLIAMAKDPAVDLYTPILHGQGQTILRELQLVADHNAYHTGEFAILRQVMQTWGKSHQE